jgi:hypothetical protein
VRFQGFFRESIAPLDNQRGIRLIKFISYRKSMIYN